MNDQPWDGRIVCRFNTLGNPNLSETRMGERPWTPHGPAQRTMLASEWLKKAVYSRASLHHIENDYFWTHLWTGEAAPIEAGFSRRGYATNPLE